MHSSGIDL